MTLMPEPRQARLFTGRRPPTPPQFLAREAWAEQGWTEPTLVREAPEAVVISLRAVPAAMRYLSSAAIHAVAAFDEFAFAMVSGVRLPKRLRPARKQLRARVYRTRRAARVAAQPSSGGSWRS